MTEQQIDPSNGTAMEFDRGDPARRCTAHRKNGDQCRKWAIVGGTVCATHGGAAKHVRNAARARIANAADLMAKQLLKMAVADDVSDAVKLAAIRDALDRAGLGARAGVDVEISTSPFEQIFTQVEIGSRADYRRSVGTEDDTSDPPALADLIAPGFAETTDDDDSPIDVEVLSEHEYAARVAARPFVNADSHAVTPDDAERQRDGRTAPGTGQPDDRTQAARLAGIHPPVDTRQPMTLTDANDVVADMRAHAAEQRRADVAAAREAGRAVIRQSQRALPRGRG